jgi:hypothetical protein
VFDGLGSGNVDVQCLETIAQNWVTNGDDSEPDCATNDTDDCGVCAGGNADMDCAGDCFGSSYTDMCNTCDADSSNDCVQDCAGVWGGDSENDVCGVCDGLATYVECDNPHYACDWEQVDEAENIQDCQDFAEESGMEYHGVHWDAEHNCVEPGCYCVDEEESICQWQDNCD